MATYVGENSAVVAGLVLVLLVYRPSQNFVPILFVLAIRPLQLEHFHLARGCVETGTARQSCLHLDSERHTFLPAVLLRREFGAYAVHLQSKGGWARFSIERAIESLRYSQPRSAIRIRVPLCKRRLLWWGPT